MAPTDKKSLGQLCMLQSYFKPNHSPKKISQGFLMETPIVKHNILITEAIILWTAIKLMVLDISFVKFI